MTLPSVFAFNRYLKLLLIMVVIGFCCILRAQTPHTVDSLKAALAVATTPADSVEILHNLYDCYFFEERKPILYQIYETSERAGDYSSMLESLFVLTVMYQDNPEMESELIRMAERAPESDIQKAYILYIKLRYQNTRLRNASEAERRQSVHQAMKDYQANERPDKFDRIACLFLICNNLRSTTDSKLLMEYLRQLQELVEDLPADELAVRTLFYALSVSTYVENEMYDMALEANKRALELVGMFDRRHAAQGRVFRNYDGSLYRCYHEMLVCAQELTDEEIEKYYQLTREIAARNPRIHTDTSWQSATRIYYLMAKHRYAEALPLLKEQLKSHPHNAEYFQFAKLLVNAAHTIGDQESELLGLKIINSVYRERLVERPDVRLSELQTLYDLENLTDKNRDLSTEQQQMAIERQRQSVIIVTVAVVMAMCMLLWLLRLYMRSRRLARRLSVSNKIFVDERNSHSEIFVRLVKMRDKARVADVTKSNFIKKMSSRLRVPLDAIVEYSRRITDSTKDDARSYIKDYAHTISVNTDLLIRLVNDILDLPLLENGEVSISRSKTSVNEVCSRALEAIRKHVSPEVKLVFRNLEHPDSMIVTDPERVEHVLIQLLANAAKFTEAGTITLGYDISPSGDTITFTVADTGIGLPHGAENKIFDRFVKMDPTSQGGGLGLYIGRLTAEMLGGKLTIDDTYSDGAKFDFTIPAE